MFECLGLRVRAFVCLGVCGFVVGVFVVCGCVACGSVVSGFVVLFVCLYMGDFARLCACVCVSLCLCV